MARAKYLVIWNDTYTRESGAFYTSWLDMKQDNPNMELTIIDRVRDLVSFDGGATWGDIDKENA